MKPRLGRIDLLGVALAVGAALVMFGPTLWSGRTLSGGDLVLWVPEFIQSYRDGLFFPRWFPYYYAGLAQQFQFLSHAAFTMVLAPPFAFHGIQFTLDVIVAGVGMWFLLRAWNLRLGACAVGALAFPLSNHLLTWVQAGHLWKYDTTCWTPWLLLALSRAHTTGRFTWFAWAGAFLGLHLLGGDVQLAYYVGLVLTAWTAGRALVAWRDRRAGRRPPLGPGVRRRQALGHALCLVVAAGIGAEVIHHYAHLLTTQDVIVDPDTPERWTFATEFSLPPEETVGLVLGGGIFGHTLDGPHYWGRSIARGTDDYLGVIALCFAACGLYVRRDRRTLAWAGIALVALLLAYGKYVPVLYRTIYALPFMSALRNPNRWLFVTAWGAALVTAFGADAWLAAAGDATYRRRLGHVVAAIGGVAVVGVIVVVWQRFSPLWWRNALYAPLSRPTVDATEVALRLGVLHAELARAVFVLVAWVGVSGAWLLARPKRPDVAAGLAAAAVVFLVGADLAGHARPFIRTYDAKVEFARTALIDTLLIPPLGGRVKLWNESPALRHEVTHRFPYFGVPSVDVISSRRPRAYTAILTAWRAGDLSTERVFQLFHVTTLLSTQPLPGTAPAHTSLGLIDGVYVAQLHDAAPRAQVVGDFNVLGEAAILRRMIEPDFDPAAELLLETRPPVRLGAFGEPVEGTARIAADTPHHVAFSVSASRDALLLVHDLYDSYWTATVGGEPTPVLRANTFLRAVAVPAGPDTRVEFTYAPPRWPWALTLAGWWGMGIGAAWAAYRWWRQSRAAAAGAT